MNTDIIFIPHKCLISQKCWKLRRYHQETVRALKRVSASLVRKSVWMKALFSFSRLRFFTLKERGARCLRLFFELISLARCVCVCVGVFPIVNPWPLFSFRARRHVRQGPRTLTSVLSVSAALRDHGSWPHDRWSFARRRYSHNHEAECSALYSAHVLRCLKSDTCLEILNLPPILTRRLKFALFASYFDAQGQQYFDKIKAKISHIWFLIGWHPD